LAAEFKVDVVVRRSGVEGTVATNWAKSVIDTVACRSEESIGNFTGKTQAFQVLQRHISNKNKKDTYGFMM
jgi:hypothetical protein